MSSPRSWWQARRDRQPRRAVVRPAGGPNAARCALRSRSPRRPARCGGRRPRAGSTRATAACCRRATGVVVVDLSLSIEDDTSGAVRAALRRLIAADAPVGLVVFSDVPYELLPPGTPPAELKGLVRMLTPTAGAEVVNPWSDTFRGGTRISTAMKLAKDMIEGDHVKNGSILLISDLETAPDDVPALARVLRSVQQAKIPVHLVALGPSSDSRLLFGEILGQGAFEPPPPRRAEQHRDARPRAGGRSRASCSCSARSSCSRWPRTSGSPAGSRLPRAPRVSRRAA